LENFGIDVNWPMTPICICYCDHMWVVCVLGWGVWTCLACFVK